MVAKKDKKAQKRGDIEIRTSDIFVVSAQKYRPYIESFSETPTNFTKQKMGTLLGFFYISDFSPDSANVVNFLTSAVKKEYFVNPRRNIMDSFEAALHHINCALAEIAKDGNIGWLGNIDAALCVIDRQMIHFSVAGEARILLIRDGMITDISEGLASEEAAEHPLKTFADIASGKLKENDKVIIATPELFSLFSIEELEKYAARFSHKKFLQFINTALVNECNVAGAFIFDVRQKETIEPPAIHKSATVPQETPPKEIGNVYGANTFKEQQGTSQGHKDAHKIKAVPALTKKESSDKKGDDYTDKTTGHIYINGEDDGTERTPLTPIMSHIQDFYEDTKHATKNTSKSVYGSTKTTVKNTFRQAGTHSSLLFKKHTTLLSKKFSKPKETNTIKKSTTSVPTSKESTTLPSAQQTDQPSITFLARVKGLLLHSIYLIKKLIRQIIASVQDLFRKDASSMPSSQSESVSHAPKVTRIYHKLSARQKYAALAIVLLIILAPLFIHKISDVLQKEDAQEVATEESSEESITDIGQPTVDQTIDDGTTLLTKDGVADIHTLDDMILATTDAAVILWADGQQQDFTLPSDAGTIENTTIMSDLNLLFIQTDTNKLYAFSPVDKKFTLNSVDFPETVSDIETYSTYLYVADTDSKQIYRYPRITDGFGERTTWLKDNADVDFENFIDMAVNENLYIATNTQLTSYSRGEKDDTNFDTNDATIASFSSVQDAEFLSILDTDNAQLFQITKDGTMKKDWVHPDFANAQNFSIDEENNKAFFTIDNAVKEFSL